MPTYDYQCRCGHRTSVFQSISEYVRAPSVPACALDGHVMERRLSVVPAMSGLANALAGDRHYDGLRAPDGTDISSRSKHREYMKRTGYADTSDFKGVWEQAGKERQALRTATFQDKEMRQEITQQVLTAVAQPN
jgi:putative FmdB family regulatory protein